MKRFETVAEFIGLEAALKKKILEGLEKLRPEQRIEALSQALVDADPQFRLQAVERVESMGLSALYSSLMWGGRQPKGGLRSAVALVCWPCLPKNSAKR
jgi:hypothetical protein